MSGESVAQDQLASFVDRILRLKEEAKAINTDIREIYAEAKGSGFDKTALGKLVNYVEKRAEKPNDLAEAEAVFDLYLTAYDSAKGRVGTKRATHTHEANREDRAKRRTSEAMDDNKALSAELVAAGLITPEAHAENVAISDGVARKYGAGVIDASTGEITHAGSDEEITFKAPSSNGFREAGEVEEITSERNTQIASVSGASGSKTGDLRNTPEKEHQPSPTVGNATASDASPADEAVADIQPETVQQAEPADAAVTVGNDLREPVAAEQGQIVREGDAPRETDHQNDGDDCQDDGDASCLNAEFGPHLSAGVLEDADAHSDGVWGPTAGSGYSADRQPIPTMTRAERVKQLRPNCQHPDMCRSSGGKEHCFSCRRAAAEQGASSNHDDLERAL